MGLNDAKRDANSVVTLIGVSSADGITPVTVYVDPITHRVLVQAAGGGGTGTVTSVSVVTANGISGSVANPTTAAAITLILGAITPTSVNGLTITTTTGTFTLTNAKTLSVTNTLTLSGTDGSTLNIGTGGTLGTAAYTAASSYALVANPLSQFAATTSAQLAGVISDETGSGALVFANSPTLVTPVLGAATGTSLVLSGNFTSNSAITIASSASAILDDINISAQTTTITGTTAINTTKGFNKFSIYQPTYTDASAVTIANAATLYIDNAPLAAGSVTITNSYSLWVNAGTVNLTGEYFVNSSNFTIGGITAKMGYIRQSNTTVANLAYIGFTGTNGFSAASGSQTLLNLAIGVNQSSTAGYTGLLLNATETSTGSGAKNLLDLQVGAISKFKVDNTGIQTNPQIINTSNAITASGNAATVPITSRISTVTNNSAGTLTVTITTSGAVDGQMVIVRILDFSAAAQTITWVNTENSTVTAPVTSNGSTTLPLTVGFQYNNATTKWRCIASA